MAPNSTCSVCKGTLEYDENYDADHCPQCDIWYAVKKSSCGGYDCSTLKDQEPLPDETP